MECQRLTSFHLNSPVRGLTSVGILRRANSTSSWVKILIRVSYAGLEFWDHVYQLAFARAGNWGIANAVQIAQGREMQPQMLLLSVLTFGIPKRHEHIHPPPSGETLSSIQSSKYRRHQETRKERADRSEDLNNCVSSSKFVGFVVA